MSLWHRECCVWRAPHNRAVCGPVNATCNAVPHVQTKHSCYWFHRVASSVDNSKQCCQHCSQKCNCQEQQAAHPDPGIYELLVWRACNITMVPCLQTVQCCHIYMDSTLWHSLLLFLSFEVIGHVRFVCPATRSCSSCWRKSLSVWQDMRHTFSDQRQDTATDIAHMKTHTLDMVWLSKGRVLLRAHCCVLQYNQPSYYFNLYLNVA